MQALGVELLTAMRALIASRTASDLVLLWSIKETVHEVASAQLQGDAKTWAAAGWTAFRAALLLDADAAADAALAAVSP